MLAKFYELQLNQHWPSFHLLQICLQYVPSKKKSVYIECLKEYEPTMYCILSPIQCGAVIMQSIVTQIFTKDTNIHHSSPGLNCTMLHHVDKEFECEFSIIPYYGIPKSEWINNFLENFLAKQATSRLTNVDLTKESFPVLISNQTSVKWWTMCQIF